MENCRKSVFFLFLFIVVAGFNVPARAGSSVEEKKSAANYDETLPMPEDASAIQGEISTPASQVSETMPVVPVASVPISVTPVAVSTEQPVTPTVSQEQAVAATSSGAGAPAAVVPAASPADSGAEASSKPEAVPSPGAAPQSAPREMPETQVFTKTNPSGLITVTGYKYPVFLFAPPDYRMDQTYPMIMVAPAETAKAEKQIEYLTGLAQRKSVFVLAPYVLWMKPQETPYKLDEWLFAVKKDVMERYPISKKRVYLLGVGTGAHYAAYMAARYPGEFAAAALLGQAWDGPFSQLILPSSDASKQIPFYIAFKAGGDAKAANQAWFDKFQGKGYPLHLVEYKSDDELDDLEFKKSVFNWMEETGQSWAGTVAKSHQTWKGKFKKGVKDFFTV